MSAEIIEALKARKTLGLILKYELSIRCIPKTKIRMCWASGHNRKRHPSYNMLVEQRLKKIDPATFAEWRKRGYYHDETHFYRDGWLCGRFIATTIENTSTGGKWMAAPPGTGSIQAWSAKNDNLSDTLEEAVAKCVEKIEQEKQAQTL